jgi:hypothetical protein
MVEIGDRIAVASAKAAPSKHGTVVAKSDTMLTIEWEDGRRSLFSPAPGAVTIETPAAPQARRGTAQRPVAR